ncbi:hypothetical protein EHS25_007613 [Saitozyma podzolica]|uniref:Uncharacterized protein n=1 Tax=Saitozyma podzolica TaxID=1890683 RepID=A0A427YQB2_9TREE|nr:hypothetical protein EHS25_007613 [Saitozyma podzolica]
MATSYYPFWKSQSPRTQVIAHASLKAAQATAMLLPPLYLVSSLLIRRGTRPFSIARWMRVSTGGTVVGAGIGAGLGWLRLRDQPDYALEDRAYRLANNASQLRADDYSIIGAALSALLIPAIFLRRASLPALVLGGASIGLGVGTWTHIVKVFTEGEKVKPEGMVGEVPVVDGNEK